MAEKIDFASLYELSSHGRGTEALRTARYIDYILTLAIPQIQNELGFVLKGGTALIKSYSYPYRFSYDMDFSYFRSERKRSEAYKDYAEPLNALVKEMGFRDVTEDSTYSHGGEIYKIQLQDDKKRLERPIKLSVSSIDESPCFPTEKRNFNIATDYISEEEKKIYSDTIALLSKQKAEVLAAEELCAEKIRALTTRMLVEKTEGVILRDVIDLDTFARKGALGEVLKNPKCLVQKFRAIDKMNFSKRLGKFLEFNISSLEFNEEEKDQILNKKLLNETRLKKMLTEIQDRLKELKKGEKI